MKDVLFLIEQINKQVEKGEYESKDSHGHSIVVSARVPEYWDTILEYIYLNYKFMFNTKSEVIRAILYHGVKALLEELQSPGAILNSVLGDIMEDVEKSLINQRMTTITKSKIIELLKVANQEQIEKLKQKIERLPESELKKELLIYIDTYKLLKKKEEEEKNENG